MGSVWIGFSEVSKGRGCELDFQGVGAFVWWVTQADSDQAFLRKLNNVLDHYKLVLLEVTNIKRYEETDNLSEEVHEMAERVMENEDWILFGTFHNYSHHNA